ncbi:hypothetical protein AQUCO_06100004v1 [Aquilegia coerulea]|uniref:Angiotensin-converting enzyme 2 n=1 Tax=Aquilegia coerulea TaxID=218851 RepID=A0A2G5CD40_AQUCA|nr:hypothetical protein AQUCO_06100004v1 [Aquilegia coerulea]
MLHEHKNHLPCLHCHPHSYIRMVQHLIERCLILRMSLTDCIKALAERASIQPVITSTVWKELQKENKEFFHTYFHDNSQRHGRPLTRVSRFRRRNMLN